MKVLKEAGCDKRDARLVLCCDVGKDRIEYCGRAVQEHCGEWIEGGFCNRTGAIEKAIQEHEELAREWGLEGLLVVCEPSGGYEKQLLRLARMRGHGTAQVNGEWVSKLKVVESNDSGKTDHKDPRVMQLLVGLGKLQPLESVQEPYEQLRVLSRLYEAEDRRGIELRNELHQAIWQLFPDFPLKTGFWYTPAGAALVKLLGANPYRIAAMDFERFDRWLRKLGSRLRKATSRGIWEAAGCSARHQQSEPITQHLQEQIVYLYHGWEQVMARKQQLREALGAVVKETEEYERLRELPRLKPYQLGRLLGEVGPLKRFSHWRQLVRYCGLNLRERRSGKYEGLVKISKKGCRLARRVLYQLVYSSWITPGGLYAKAYAQLKTRLANGMKAIVSLMRKAAKMIYGVARTNQAFDPRRVELCAGEYHKLLAA